MTTMTAPKAKRLPRHVEAVNIWDVIARCLCAYQTGRSATTQATLAAIAGIEADYRALTRGF